VSTRSGENLGVVALIGKKFAGFDISVAINFCCAIGCFFGPFVVFGERFGHVCQLACTSTSGDYLGPFAKVARSRIPYRQTRLESA
jgi:hypothetical protein